MSSVLQLDAANTANLNRNNQARTAGKFLSYRKAGKLLHARDLPIPNEVTRSSVNDAEFRTALEDVWKEMECFVNDSFQLADKVDDVLRETDDRKVAKVVVRNLLSCELEIEAAHRLHYRCRQALSWNEPPAIELLFVDSKSGDIPFLRFVVTKNPTLALVPRSPLHKMPAVVPTRYDDTSWTSKIPAEYQPVIDQILEVRKVIEYLYPCSRRGRSSVDQKVDASGDPGRSHEP